jgi:hypothetical protein
LWQTLRSFDFLDAFKSTDERAEARVEERAREKKIEFKNHNTPISE